MIEISGLMLTKMHYVDQAYADMALQCEGANFDGELGRLASRSGA